MYFRPRLLVLPTARHKAPPAPLQRVLTGAQLDDPPAAQTLVSSVEHRELQQEGAEPVWTFPQTHNHNVAATAVTCPGVRALSDCESHTHREPSAFSVTVQGTVGRDQTV